VGAAGARSSYKGGTVARALGLTASWAELWVLRESMSRSPPGATPSAAANLCECLPSQPCVPARAGLGDSHSPAWKPRLRKTTGLPRPSQLSGQT